MSIAVVDVENETTQAGNNQQRNPGRDVGKRMLPSPGSPLACWAVGNAQVRLDQLFECLHPTPQ